MHAPHYRQESIDARCGIVISRQTRQRVAEHVAHLPISTRAQLKQRILDSGVDWGGEAGLAAELRSRLRSSITVDRAGPRHAEENMSLAYRVRKSKGWGLARSSAPWIGGDKRNGGRKL